jgi:hypothetical protein
MTSLTRGLVATTALALSSISAQAAIVNGSFTIDSATIVDLYSATLDGPCTPAPGTFFNCTTPAYRSVVITDNNVGVNPGSGTLDVQFDDSTGQITQVNSLNINLRDMTLVITPNPALFGPALGTTTVTIVNGNGVPVNGPEDDIANVVGGTLGPSGSADADEGGIPASVFQHDDAPNTDAPDFSTFLEVVDTCVINSGGGVCGLLGLLSLDGVRYQLDGLINAAGGDALQLTAQTSNNSIYQLNFTTAVVPVPAAVWLMGSALAGLAALRRRAKA